MNETTVNGGANIVRQEFGATSVERVLETAQSAMAAQARAAIEAAYVVARANPRSWDQVRVKLLDECKRPAFANAAWFRKPQGGSFVEGLSVRFAETALRIAGNLRRGARTTYESERARQVNIFVVDVETNSESSRDVTIEKTVERKNPKGRLVLQQRTNSAGEPVYVVASTADEMMQLEGAIISKVGRVLILQMIPGDILDECREQIRETRNSASAKDPGAARKALADAFAGLGVMPVDLAKYLGHDIAQCTPFELDDLRGIYAAIRDGEASWLDALASKTGDVASETGGASMQGDPAASADAKPRGRGSRLAAQARAQAVAGAAADLTTPAQTTVQPASSQNAAPVTPATKPGTPTQTEMPGTGPTVAAGGGTVALKPGETPVTPPAQTAPTPNAAEDRAKRLAEQTRLMNEWPTGENIPVYVHNQDGEPTETYTVSKPRMNNEIAIINIASSPLPVPLANCQRIV